MPKTLQQAKKHTYRFWETQPVPRLGKKLLFFHYLYYIFLHYVFAYLKTKALAHWLLTTKTGNRGKPHLPKCWTVPLSIKLCATHCAEMLRLNTITITIFWIFWNLNCLQQLPSYFNPFVGTLLLFTAHHHQHLWTVLSIPPGCACVWHKRVCAGWEHDKKNREQLIKTLLCPFHRIHLTLLLITASIWHCILILWI